MSLYRVAWAVLCFAAAFGINYSRGGGQGSVPPERAESDILQSILGGKSVPASSFFLLPGAKVDKTTCVLTGGALVNELEGAGALRVTAIGVHDDSETAHGAEGIVITLPDDPDTRASVIDLVRQRCPSATIGTKHALLY